MTTNGKTHALKDIDPSLLKITPNPSPRTLPTELPWGGTFSNHMLTIKHTPGEGWGAPEIKPYGNLEMSPASAVFHYAPSLFEGMKAYKNAGQEPRLFRPDMNMARMNRSAARVALPAFNPEALISLISTLVKVDESFIPPPPYSLYIRPTMIGTRPTLGVGASDDCMLFVIMSPVGPFFPRGFKPVSLLATMDAVRSWPGGTGSFKLALNYAPCFVPQKEAQSLGYDQNLWCMGDTVTECGQMNLFVVYQTEDGVNHLITPPLNGQILPGITRDSLLTLTRSHISSSLTIAGLPTDRSTLVVEEREFGLTDLKQWNDEGKLKECFGAGTAAIICPVERIGIPTPSPSGPISDIHIPTSSTGLGLIASALHAAMTAIQEGRMQGPEGWSVACDSTKQ